MTFRQLRIPGVFEFTPTTHGDERGQFLEWFTEQGFAGLIGHRLRLAQANMSISRSGVIRGIHFADVPPGQAKYVICPKGAVFDVAVDIRLGSPTFGLWDAVLLDDKDHRAIYLPEGIGHAFMALDDDSVVVYLCSEPYSPAREHGIYAMDPDVGIEWPTTTPSGASIVPILSEKDAQAPRLATLVNETRLPDFEAVRAYVASLGADTSQEQH